MNRNNANVLILPKIELFAYLRKMTAKVFELTNFNTSMRFLFTYRAVLFIFVTGFFILSSCAFRKGDGYTWQGTADTVTYFIRASNRHVNHKLEKLLWVHGNKGDDCRVVYLSDSAQIEGRPGVLLFSSALPDLKKDMLEKGFMGTFASRQVVTYLVVAREELPRYLKPATPKRQE